MEQTINTFTKGLQSDTHPMMTSNNTLTDCLNGTILTQNGNEIILLNDMGNRRIDNAFLPSGYLPVGMKEYGGIIYVAAYNPITNKSQIGSFPSPERKITLNNFNLNLNNNLIEYFADTKTNFVNSDSVLIPLTLEGNESISLHPGDKFIIYTADNSNPISKFETLLSNYNNTTGDKVYSPKNKLFTMSVGVINSLNEFVDITSSLVRWKNNEIVDSSGKSETYIFNYGYFIPNLEDKSTLTIEDNNFRLNRMITKDTNTYSYKLVGPLYLKIHLNHIEKFNYTISGVKSEDKLESLTIKGQVEYNCPDGVDPSILEPSDYLFNSYSGNNNIYKYEASLHEGKQLDNTSFLDFYKKGDSNTAKGYKDKLEIFTKISYDIKYSDEIKNEIDNIIGESYKDKLDEINFYTEPSDIILISKEYDTKNEKWKLDILPLQIGSTILTASFNNVTSTILINIINPNIEGNTSETETTSEDITNIDWLSLVDVEKYIYSSIYNESTNLYRVNFRYKYKINLSLPGNNLWPYKIGVRANIKDEASNYYLSEFSTKGILNLDLINSNTIKVILWRFFNNVENELTDLSYYLECYPEEDIEFKNLKIKFIRINLDGSDGKSFIREVPGLVQTGLNHITLLWNDDFEPKALYKVSLSCDNKSGNIVDDYWFLTTELFNDCYYLGSKYVNNYCKPSEKNEINIVNDLLTVKLNFNTKETILSDISQFPKLIKIGSNPSDNEPITYTRTLNVNIQVDLSNLISDLYPDCIYQIKSIPLEINEITSNLAKGDYSSEFVTIKSLDGSDASDIATNNDGSSSSSSNSNSGNTKTNVQISQRTNSKTFEIILEDSEVTSFWDGDNFEYTCGFNKIDNSTELENIVDPYTQIGIGFLNRSAGHSNAHRLNLKWLSTRWTDEQTVNWDTSSSDAGKFTDDELDYVATDSPLTFMIKNYIDDIARMTDTNKVWLAGFGSCNYPSADEPKDTYHGLFYVNSKSKSRQSPNTKTTSRLWLRGVNGELALVNGVSVTKGASAEPKSTLVANKVLELIGKYYYYTNKSGKLTGFLVSDIFDSHQYKTGKVEYLIYCDKMSDEYIKNNSQEIFTINIANNSIETFSTDNQPFIDYLLNYNIYNIRNIDLTTGYMTDIEGNPLNINYVYIKKENGYLKKVDIPLRYSTEIKCGDKNSLMFFGNTSNLPVIFRYDTTHTDEDDSKTYLDYAGINVINLSS